MKDFRNNAYQLEKIEPGRNMSGVNYQLFWVVTGLAVAASRDATATPSVPVGDFDFQVKTLLDNEMLTRVEIANLSTVFQDLQLTLRERWPDNEVIPLGSFVTGLATKTSDADCMIKIPKYGVTSDRYLVMETARLLMKHPDIYSQVRTKVDLNRRIPLLKVNYVPTKRNCDVNFISNIALQNSLMMGYFFSLNKKFLTLAAILKLWSKIHDLRSTDTLASNTLNLLIIFYLQQSNIAPPFHLLQKHLIQCPLQYWETRFKKISFNPTVDASLYELLGGFFQYYDDYNFDEYVVSPFLGRSIPKKYFEDVDKLPDELSLYKRYIKLAKSKPLVLNTKLCVQDPIELRRNTAADVSHDKAINLISHIKSAAQMFEMLPKDVFLQVLFR